MSVGNPRNWIRPLFGNWIRPLFAFRRNWIRPLFGVTCAGFRSAAPLIWPIAAPKATEAAPRPVGNNLLSEMPLSLRQTNNPVAGGARDSGNVPTLTGVTFSSRLASILRIASGSWMLAMIFAPPPRRPEVHSG